jgi:hypothetical protein
MVAHEKIFQVTQPASASAKKNAPAVQFGRMAKARNYANSGVYAVARDLSAVRLRWLALSWVAQHQPTPLNLAMMKQAEIAYCTLCACGHPLRHELRENYAA